MEKKQASETTFNQIILDEIICELGVNPDQSPLYRVERPFFLNVRFGPLTEIRKGVLVRLETPTAAMLFFSGKIEPILLAEIFEAIHPFCVDEGGTWIEIEAGDILKLNRLEALPLLRQGKIKERRVIVDEVKSA